MPNKDSFTFSDKLKKSKSLPLSKRIPSRSGGDGKAKRTLIQRAQRDLPFIIVAAAALLLLPLLSRNSGTDYVSGLDNLGYDNFVGDGGHGLDYIPGDGDIVPADRRNPLDMIITNKGHQDTPAMEEDEYEPPTSSMIDDNRRESFSHEEVTSKPNISTYGKAAKGGIRNSATRKPTELGALRNRNLSFGNGNGGLTRNLAIGGAPTRNAGPNAPRAGVRPVALQPMTTSGAGRVLTGDNLYRERDRAIGALNQGPAKQALFEAQLRDVDGSPLGAAGDPRAAAARLASQGTVPDHKFNYTNQKPWWWDMMQERSQKLWELWNYNWQKALSDSLIKVATNLGMCLLTGSEDGSVKFFLGKKGGDKDVCCLIDGMELCAGDIGDYTSSTSGSGDNKETTNNSFSSIQSFCKDHGAKTYISESGRKNALQTRLGCLGIDAGKMKWASGTKYSQDCDGVNNIPLTYKVSANRKADNKERKFKEQKFVVYVKARIRDEVKRKSVKTGTNDGEFVIALSSSLGGYNTYTLHQDQIDRISANCEITRIGSFKARGNKKTVANKVDDYISDELDADGNIKGKVAQQWDYCESGNFPEGGYIDETSIQKDIKAKKGATAEIGTVCPVWNAISNFKDQNANGMTCEQPDPAAPRIDRLAETTYSVTLSNPPTLNRDGKPTSHVFAVFVETVQGARGADGKGTATKIQWIAKDTDMQKTKNADGSVTYTTVMRAGKAGTSTDHETIKSVPGIGKVYWIMTNKENLPVKVGDDLPANTLDIPVDTIVGPTAGKRYTACYYKWSCSGEECSNAPGPHPDDFEGDLCVESKDAPYKFFNALKLPASSLQVGEDIFVKIKEEQATAEEKSGFLKKLNITEDEECDANIGKAINDGKIKVCTPICKNKLENMLKKRLPDGKGGDPLGELDTVSAIPGFDDILNLVGTDNINPLCPDCNSTPEVIEKKCNIASRLLYKNASIDVNDDTNTFNQIVSSFKSCLEEISNNNNPNGFTQNLYAYGFTSKDGDGYRKENGKGIGCPIPTDIQKSGNLPKEGGISYYSAGSRKIFVNESDRKLCNKALSEDRIIYLLQNVLDQMPEELTSKVNITVQDDYNSSLIGFPTVYPTSKVNKYNRYETRTVNPTAPSSKIHLAIEAKGCGSSGNTGRADKDRLTILSTTPVACDTRN